jgi:peptidoglycan/LPS O-acetylase OafA/YrhL/peroxiredoxin
MGATATTAKAPPGSKPSARFEELDALRGAAAVSIVILHAYQTSRTVDGYAFADHELLRNAIIQLDFGLGVFFALSGFLIFFPFVKAIINGTKHIGVREFAVRRLFRILPLYYVAMFVVWNSRYSGSDGQWADLLRHLTFTQIYHNEKIFYTIGPSWSLAVEMHYYVITGILVWLLTIVCRRVPSRNWRIALVCVGPVLLVVGSIFYKYWAYYIAGISLDNQPPPHTYTVYYSALARGDAFGMGMLMAVLVAVMGTWRPKTPWLATGLSVVALLPFAYFVTVRGDRITDPPFVALFFFTFVGISTVMLMFAMVIGEPKWRIMRFLRSGPVQFTGVVSYSLYIWHEPLMLFLKKHHILDFTDERVWPFSTAALVAIGLALAWVSWRFIEIPGGNLRKLLQIHRPRVARRLRRVGELRVRRGTEIAVMPPLLGEDGAPVDLALLADGRPLVAFVHPGGHGHDDDPGSVAEARAFRDSAFLFDAMETQVVGVSTGTPEEQRAFREREGLPFPMLSDPGGKFAEAAGIPLWHDDHGGVVAERATLLIDRHGAIQEVVSDRVPPASRPSVAAVRSEALVMAT